MGKYKEISKTDINTAEDDLAIKKADYESTKGLKDKTSQKIEYDYLVSNDATKKLKDTLNFDDTMFKNDEWTGDSLLD